MFKSLQNYYLFFLRKGIFVISSMYQNWSSQLIDVYIYVRESWVFDSCCRILCLIHCSRTEMHLKWSGLLLGPQWKRKSLLMWQVLLMISLSSLRWEVTSLQFCNFFVASCISFRCPNYDIFVFYFYFYFFGMQKGGPSSGDFQEIEGESEERRRARLKHHKNTQHRMVFVCS